MNLKPLLLSLALAFPASAYASVTELELSALQMEAQVADVKTFNIFTRLSDGQSKLTFLDSMIKSYTSLIKSYTTLLDLYSTNKYLKNDAKADLYRKKLQDVKDTLDLFQPERDRVYAVLNPVVAPPAPTNFRTTEYLANWALDAIHAETAYKQGWTGKGVTVAVIDSGLGQRTEFANALAGYTVMSGVVTNGAVDDFGHGTHVAGIVAAAKNDALTQGVAYDATILPIKVLNSSGSTVDSRDVHRALKIAVAQGAKVANLSLGARLAYTIGGTNPYNEGMFNFVYTDSGFTATPDLSSSGFIQAINAGMVVVTAAGNSAASCLPDANNAVVCNFPAALPIVKGFEGLTTGVGGFIAVGATDQTGKLAYYSNKAGVMKDWYIVAPGSNVLSTDEVSGTATMSGTSMATPVVSGAAALLIQKFPHLTGNQITQIIFMTADDLGAPGVDVVYGHGALNVDRAMQPIGDIKLPTGSTVSSSSQSLTNTVIVVPASLANALQKSQALQATAVLDLFDRAFVVDLTKAVVVSKSKYDFADYKPYSAGNFRLGLKEGTSDMTLGYAFNKDWSVHYGHEAGLFGGVSSGALSTGTTQTHYFRAAWANNGWSAWMDYGVAPATHNGDSLITGTSALHGLGGGIKYGWALDRKSDASLKLASPVSIVKGTLNLHVPMARDIDGNITYQDERLNIQPDHREVNLTFGYAYRADKRTNLSADLSLIANPDNLPGNGVAVGVKWERKI